MARVLELDGQEVCRAADAVDGSRKLRELRPEVAFVDIRMSNMGGYVFTRGKGPSSGPRGLR